MIALDYRKKTNDPPVVYIQNETRKVIKLADHFDEFIKGLFINNEFFTFNPDEEERWEKGEISEQELRTTLLGKDPYKIYSALIYLIHYPNEEIFESIVFDKLLKHSNNQIKIITANFFYICHRDRSLPLKYINRAVEIMKNDPDTVDDAKAIENWKFDEE